jgi:putative transposase
LNFNGLKSRKGWPNNSQGRKPLEPSTNLTSPEGAMEVAMGATHLCLIYHVIFSTKHRQPFINTLWHDRLNAYMAGIIRETGGTAHMIGGMADHMHLLIQLRATHVLADVMRELKALSSKWVHDEIREPEFMWQPGYAALTVSPSQQGVVKRYIANQKTHHMRRDFQQEYLEFLQKAAIEYDEKYIWS